ncbi:Gfo/Idh/MocA family protein [Streptomyces sp. NPDC057889]|uniref:Gfo/Idh/MocA family protein n=1 Tax=unclassified Streptomyces TaxID=2593676 RepID=UPI0036C107BA
MPALAELDGYELRALSASSAESARAAGEKCAVPLAYGSVEELARSEEVDLVVVTVKVPHHLELIRPALEAGKMVFGEWPLGADLAQAEDLADLAYRRGVLTAVGLQARSAPPLRYLRDLVAEGYVGRVLSRHKKPENVRRYFKPFPEAIAELTSLIALGDARR